MLITFKSNTGTNQIQADVGTEEDAEAAAKILDKFFSDLSEEAYYGETEFTALF